MVVEIFLGERNTVVPLFSQHIVHNGFDFSRVIDGFLRKGAPGIIAHAYIREGQLDAIGRNVPRWGFLTKVDHEEVW